jgi:hypothetical protein
VYEDSLDWLLFPILRYLPCCVLCHLTISSLDTGTCHGSEDREHVPLLLVLSSHWWIWHVTPSHSRTNDCLGPETWVSGLPRHLVSHPASGYLHSGTVRPFTLKLHINANAFLWTYLVSEFHLSVLLKKNSIRNSTSFCLQIQWFGWSCRNGPDSRRYCPSLDTCGPLNKNDWHGRELTNSKCIFKRTRIFNWNLMRKKGQRSRKL